MRKNNLLLLFGILLFSSCARKLTESDLPKVKHERTQDLLDVLDSLSRKRPNTFYTKIATKYSDTTRNISVKTSLRMISDSAINTIVTYAGFPVVNALITKDSLLLVNKKDKCLVQADMDFIKNNFGVDFTFQNLEEIIYGIPLDYDTTQKYFQIREPYRYVISSVRKRKLKRTERLLRAEEDVAVRYFINGDLNQLDGLEITSPTDTTTITVNYVSRQFVNGFNIPDEVTIQVNSPRNNLLMELTYTKVEINEPTELYFIVPEDYEECK
jgi:hypothetical protein